MTWQDLLREDQERLFDPEAPPTMMNRLNDIPGGPDSLAAAVVRRRRQADFYSAHPRAYEALARLPLWRRW